MNKLPFVSIIIPTRNEEKYIGLCLNSVIANAYQKDKIEILVIDGMSEDRTRELVKEYVRKYSYIKILDNPNKIKSNALNIGIKKATGDYILIIDGHTVISKDFIKKNSEFLQKSKIECVGGILITLPVNNRSISQSIATALSHPFGVGNAYFRIGSKKPRLVDTVPFGCYKKEVFQKIGLFDEDLIRNQDDEFNLRLIKNGGKILLVPEIVSYYYARGSLYNLWKMYFQYGYFKPLVAQKVGTVLTWRQLMPPVFVASTAGSLILGVVYKPFILIFFLTLGLYILVNLVFSIKIGLEKKLKNIFFLFITFATLHFSYGFGYLKGCFDIVILKKYKKKKIKDMPLTR